MTRRRTLLIENSNRPYGLAKRKALRSRPRGGPWAWIKRELGTMWPARRRRSRTRRRTTVRRRRT